MVARKKKTDGDQKLHRLDRYGNRHEIDKKDVPAEPQPALPAAQTD